MGKGTYPLEWLLEIDLQNPGGGRRNLNPKSCLLTSMCVMLHVRVHTHIHTLTHAYMHTNIYTHTTYAHTHKHTHIKHYRQWSLNNRNLSVIIWEAEGSETRVLLWLGAGEGLHPGYPQTTFLCIFTCQNLEGKQALSGLL